MVVFMEKNEKHIVVDTKTHKTVKLESVKKDISMGDVVRIAVIEYLERHKIEVNDLTPAKKTQEKEENLMDFIKNQNSIKKK